MKSCKHSWSIVVFTGIILFTWCSFGFCYGDDEKARNTLRGIGIIGIVVDWDGTGIEEEVLKACKEKIQKNIALQLKQEGIKVHSEGTIETPPFLYIEIHSYRCGNNVHAAYFGVKLMQEIFLKEQQSVTSTSPTWSSGGVVGIVREEAFEDFISKLVDEFTSAYLTVNPKGEVKEENSDHEESI